MVSIKNNLATMGVSDLRQHLEKTMDEHPGAPIVIEKRHKPLAILLSDEEYERIQRLLDTAEDIVLGYLAEQRYKKSRAKDYLDIESVMKKASV
jgi:prevent-host-death family protein